MQPVDSAPRQPTLNASRRWKDVVYVAAIALLLLLGAYLRLNRYLFNRSLWLDEAMFALNLIERTPLQLLGPLSYGQHSPPGFTLLVKLITMALGMSEPVLRSVPLLAGLAALPVFYGIARRWLPRWGTLLALFLFAASDALSDWSAQFEKYSSDVLLCLLVLLTALWFYESKRWTRYVVLGAVGIIAVGFSYPVAMVLAGIGLFIFVDALRRKSYSEALRLAVVAVILLAGFAAIFARSILPDVASSLVSPASYWASVGGFLTFPPRSVVEVEQDIATLVQPFEDPAGFALYSGVILLYGLGVLDAARRGGPRLLLVTPVLVAIGLSALHLYPLYGRLILFMVPLILLPVVMGMVWVSERLAHRAEKVLALGFLALILYQPARLGLARGLHPREREEMRPLMLQLSERYHAGDRVLLYYYAAPAYDYYSYLLGLDFGTPDLIENLRSSPHLYCGEIEPVVGAPRVWVIISHNHQGRQGSEEKLIVGCLDQVGRQLDMIKETGSHLYLYDLRPEPAGSTAGS